jgi:hypothetical protein
MAAPLTETSTFEPQVIVPEDGVDDETAASLVTPFQQLTNRARWLFTQVVQIAQIVNGGAITLLDDLVYTIAAGKILTIAGQKVVMDTVFTQFAGKVIGHLFTAGQDGVANKKILRVTGGSGDVAVESFGYDTVILSGIAGARTVVLGTPAAGADGHHVRIVNESSTFFVSYKPFGGANMGSDLKYTAGQMFSVDLVWSETESVWHITGYGSYLPGS